MPDPRDFRSAIRARVAPLGLAPEREVEIVEEVAQHLEDRYREAVAAGTDQATAEAASWRELEEDEVLGRELAKSERRQPLELPSPGAPARGRRFTALWQDIRYSLRSIGKQPTFAATVLMALALTIGPTTAIISVVNWMFWRPLPGAAYADRLALVWFGQWQPDGMTPSRVSYANLDDLRGSLTTADGLAGVTEIRAAFSLPDVPARVIELGQVTHNFFDVVGATIVAGRPFQPTDDRGANPAPVALVSSPFAEVTFGSAADALDKPLTLNRKTFRVVGVVAPAFRGIETLSNVEVWTTGGTSAFLGDRRATDLLSSRAFRSPFYSFVARIAPGKTADQLQTELDVRVRGLADAYPKENAQYKQVIARVFPRLNMDPFAQAEMWRTTQILLVIAGIVLLLGCANSANVLIARALGRAQEIAVRKALGASPSRLLQMELVESCLLALAGSVLGVVIALVLKQVIQQWLFRAPAASAAAIPIDERVLMVMTLTALVVGVTAGIAPAWLTMRSPESARLLRGGAGRVVSRVPRLRSGLAVGQLALSLALLIGAFMLVATLRHLNAVDLGFDPAGVVFTRVSLVGQGYANDRAVHYQRALVEQMERSFPRNAAVSFSLPTDRAGVARLRDVRGRDTRADMNAVSDTYFSTLTIPLLRGRTFTRDEAFAAVAPTPLPVVISATLARELFGQAEPVGRTLQEPRNAASPARDLSVIGVAGDVRSGSLDAGGRPAIYFPIGSYELGMFQVTALVRASRIADATQEIRNATARIDPAIPTGNIDVVPAVLERSVRLQHLFARVLSWLSALAFALSAVGLYGLVAQATVERAREFGIRLAIGATRASIARLVARYVLIISVLGTALGLMLARLGAPLVKSLLFGVSEIDAAIYAMAAGTLTLVAVLASIWPAFRATRIQPIEVLRVD